MSDLINIARAKQLNGPFQVYCAERYLIGKDVKLGPWTSVGVQVKDYTGIQRLIECQYRINQYSWRVKQIKQ